MELWCRHRIAALYSPLIGLFARSTLVLVALFASLIAVMRLQPVDNSAFDEFFACEPQPCWRGIVPGVTLEDDAVAYLESDPLIEGLTIANSYGFDRWYSWHWNDFYPANMPLIGTWQGGMYFDTKYGQGNVVDRMFLATNLHVGDLWNLFSTPDEYLLLFSYNGASNLVSLDIRYDALITMSGFSTCPITFAQFLHQPTSMWINNHVVSLQVIDPNTDPHTLRRALIDANRRTC